LEFDVEGSGIEYRPGDVLLLHCENDPGIIVPFIRNRIGLDPDQVIQVNALYPGCFLFPKELSLRDLFCKFLDVLGTPKRHFFEVAANYAASEHEIERLRELASAEVSEDLNRYCFRERRTFIEVMEDFPSLDFPLAFFLDSIPTLKPRQFSISSSPLAHGNRIHITVALVSYKTPFQRRKVGVCSSFIRNLDMSKRNFVPIWVKRGAIRLPESLSNPLVLIGPGTGIAPFRSMCHQVQALRLKGLETPQVLVFFGNRNKEKDFFYASEWQDMEKSETLKLVTAFSRDQDEKIYVQDQMRLCRDLVLDLFLKKEGRIYIAG